MRQHLYKSRIIIQNFAQLKALFKDAWETIPGNCDTFIYLGGNEQSTHKYVSELLGKGTIDKKSSGETKGRQGSSSRNYDVLGRELFTPDEVRKLDNKKCIIFIRGFVPIMDNKFIPFNHPMFNQTADGKGEPYFHQIRGAHAIVGQRAVDLAALAAGTQVGVDHQQALGQRPGSHCAAVHLLLRAAEEGQHGCGEGEPCKALARDLHKLTAGHVSRQKISFCHRFYSSVEVTLRGAPQLHRNTNR